MTNLAFIFSLMIFLELLVGSALTLFLFSLGALFSNLLTLGVLRLVLPEGDWLALSDIGISLGIFGCVGALAHFVRARAVAVVVLHLIIGSIAGLKGDIMQLNHIIAFWIGFLILQTHLKSVMFRRLGSQLINWGAGLGLIVMALAADAQADESASHWIFLPESRHQQYQTYAFLTEEQTSLLYRTGGRGWGEVGGAIALLEASHWAWKPQLILHASANAAYRLKNDITSLLTETIDARVGLFVDFEPSEGHRFSAGWTHYSGHVSDDVLDLDLFNSNMGWESLRVRYFYTRPENFRYGGTLKPIIGSDPGAKAFAADQFFEWYPVGLSGSRQQASPYLATGLEEYGGDRVRLTLQAQAGLLFGNHDRPRHEPGIRAAIGYYNGVDPRLKYAAFKFRTIQFGYAGLFIDL